MAHARILVAEKDSSLARRVRKGLESEHYAVDIAADAKEVHSLLGKHAYDLIVFDLNLPRTDAGELLRQVHSRKASPVVLAVVEHSQSNGYASGKGLAVDGFLAKPFALPELFARIGALLGSKRSSRGVLRAADLELHYSGQKVMRAGRRIELTAKEFALLECLMSRSGQSVTREIILERVWKLSPDTMSNVADVYIKSLRKKVDEGFAEKLIHTVRGIGYSLGANAGDTF